MQITHVRSTELFVAHDGVDAQVLAVEIAAADAAATITVRVGDEVVGTAPAADGTVEVPLIGLAGRTPGEQVEVAVDAGGESTGATVTVAEPGWTVWMISHFHYDPVWWNTQAAYTHTWDDLDGQAQQFRQAFQQTGFALVDLHLRTARADPDYKFVLAEVDYLKPYWDARPADRAYLRRLLDEGRLEIMGGTYNEPNTNLTTPETTARNFVHGAGFQRHVLGGDPHTAWQLDVFGHDPQFPGLAAEAGLTSSSWARGPYHQWGPMLTQPHPEDGWGDPSVMQFPAEFEWISPSGQGVLTHYMPAHYSAGWHIDSCTTLEDAEQNIYQLFLLLKRVAATRNVLLPVGTDYTPPSKWVTQVHRDWNARYAWPQFRTALPREFFAAVRNELDERGVSPAPQTRDMNPLYTGKDVSFIDTKQAQRVAEALLADAELFATFAALSGAKYPHAALDRAWRLLVFGAHHDAITGSESDQVYLDLLTNWREAHDLADEVLAKSLDHLASGLAPTSGDGTPITVFNPSAWERSDLVTLDVPVENGARSLEIVGPDGSVVPSVTTPPVDGTAQVQFVATVAGIGHGSGWAVRAADAGGTWTRGEGAAIESDRYRVEVDPAHGGCVSRVLDKRAGRDVLTGLGNELVLEQEYPEHPRFHEGPWHLVPSGQILSRSSDRPADSVHVETSPLGSRLIVTGALGTTTYRQVITLWDALERIDCRTTLDGFDGADQLLRVRWAADVPGALPVSDVGAAVVGRGFAFPGTDSAEHPWTLDNPAVNWFALSSTARVRVHENGSSVERAIGIAELVASSPVAAGELRPLAVALAGQGVTATTSVGDGPRYGSLAVDSNLPDVRIAVGGPDENVFTAAVLDAADEQYRVELRKQLDESGRGRLWVPARRPLREVWQPSADLSGVRDLPVLIVVGEQEVAALVDDLADAVVDVVQAGAARADDDPTLDDYTVALVNTGMPSFAVDTTGGLSMSVLRSCTGWPSGVWIDPPRRTAPDGSNFQQQHWTHHWDYALVCGAGDWRVAGLVRAGQAVNHPLRASLARPTGDRGAAASWLAVDGDAVVTAVKAAGNPLADGAAPGPIDAVTVRIVEPVGARGTCRLRAAFPVTGAHAADLLEQPGAALEVDDGGVAVALTPMQVRTVRLHVPTADGDVALGPVAEPHQPGYARYWLNNTGPAPLGGMPVAVHVEPTLVEHDGGPVELTVTVSSDRTDAAVDVPLAVVVPDGWDAGPSPDPVTVQPGGYEQRTVTVRPPADVAAGCWWVRARIGDGEQTVEDVARVMVGRVPDQLDVKLGGCAPLHPGESAELTVTVRNAAATDVAAQVQLVSPWHTWDLVPRWNTGVSVPADGIATVRVPVRVPQAAAAGTWWVLAKVASAGLLHYTEPVLLEVRA